VFNARGQKVKMLTKDIFPKGSREIRWNGKDDKGKSVASGLYFINLSENGKTVDVKKSILLK
jgi:flagellar hook assembly protein FlgD